MLSPELGAGGPQSIQGRTADLKSAYKQDPRLPSHRWASVVTVPAGKNQDPLVFLSDTLLFGEVSAVYGFNRLSRALLAILCAWAGLVATVYYDEFPLVEPLEIAEDAQAMLEAVLAKVGWTVAKEEKKNRPFATWFQVLGVVVDLKDFSVGRVAVRSVPDRMQSVTKELSQVLATGTLPPPQAAALAGRLQFLMSSCLGKNACVAAFAVRQRASERAARSEVRPGTSLFDALSWLRDHLCSLPPRTIWLRTTRRPVLVFTGGACEKKDGRGRVTVGAVLIVDGQAKHIAAEIPEPIAATWRCGASWQVIGQAEMFPIHLARLAWKVELTDRDGIYFVENDSARGALIKGYSPKLPSCKILASAATSELCLKSRSWYARVPTLSNIGDHPSRFEEEELRRLIPKIVRTEAPSVDEW